MTDITARPSVTVYTIPPLLGVAGNPEKFSLRRSHLQKPLSHAEKRAGAVEPYLIIGFDTEFQTPASSIHRDELKAGKAKYEVLSYQFRCETSDGIQWEGIACPPDGERMGIGEFLVFALASGIAGGHVAQLPTKIFLAGHFTRADIPAFADFKSLQALLSNVRNTFVSIDQSMRVGVKFSHETVRLNVRLRDTMLLTPATSKSLGALGELVGVPKVSLHEDKQREREIKGDMSSLRLRDWRLFKAYALNDAVICAEYLKRIAGQYHELTGKHGVPVTLTSIGVELLLKSWRAANLDDKDMLGLEEIKVERWNGRKDRFETRKERKPLEQPFFWEAFVTECYHGGRNEQFWFGPGHIGQWTDFDLASAYPTAMSLIGSPRWDAISINAHCLEDFTPTTLGFAHVEFSFPREVRFPTLPVRTANGLVFPLNGRSYCSAPELCLARSLGAKLKILQSVLVPTDPEIRVFGHFIRDCIAERKLHPKRSLSALLWKEIANSTYGKTAQGLRAKRVFDMRDAVTKPLPRSRITNAYFAAYITSAVRAVLGEIMNALPAAATVFSCTTDGFLTDALPSDVERASKGSLARLFGQARETLTGEWSITEIKHRVQQPLGWRTRGQRRRRGRLQRRRQGRPRSLLGKQPLHALCAVFCRHPIRRH